MRGNFVDLPTDCPQRDERLGWTGDIQVFAPTASFLYDCAGFLTSWLADLAAEQDELGTVPAYVPVASDLPFPRSRRPRWGDAAVVVPWVLYQRFGDLGLLRAPVPQHDAPGSTRSPRCAGDDRLWDERLPVRRLARPGRAARRPGRGPDRPGTRRDRLPRPHRARLLAETAELLGRDDGRAALRGAGRPRRARHSTTSSSPPTGRLASDAQTAYALALQFDLLRPPEQRARAGRRLAELVPTGGYRIGTGLRRHAARLRRPGRRRPPRRRPTTCCCRTDCPSWLYPVTMGATTVWERWDSMLPDGSINPGDMTSFNHYALGAVADFLHRVVAGLAPAEPGYREAADPPPPGRRPHPRGGDARTPYGDARVRWHRPGDRLVVDIVVPVGSTARVELPGREIVEVGSGAHQFECEYRPASSTRPSHPVDHRSATSRPKLTNPPQAVTGNHQ